MATLSALPLSLPRIDLTSEDLRPGTTTWDLVRGDVLQALEEYGCFEAVYGGSTNEPDQLYGSVMEQLKGVFNLPKETKQRFFEPRKPFLGYHGDLPGVPLYEAMAIAGVLTSPAIQGLADLLWSDHGNPRFCETMNAYAKKVSDLALLVKRLAFEGLGVAKYFDSHVNSTTYALRLSKYTAPDTMGAQLGTSIHTDKNFLTILQQNHVNGLEVQMKDGKWIRTSPSPSTFIVIVGESFLGWCNGRLQCPRHCVMMRGHETRYSIGLFSSLEGTIECPKELIDEEHPMLFKPFDEMALLQYTQKKIALQRSVRQTEEAPDCTLKEYFGV
ncbi:hypothetical protein CDL15_Pgr001089 [Punica granatum]|uniref:Fe2OG dioxygenase domain-containing protein n=1 Tax=Punica granatum TaxID=22663 RepID=A0A218WJJ4_PUNGR|nr:hypothetical protein CDL15_Pgr001089 [Punica granatum]